jgi:AraC family transcriptional activator of pyochelin receptor
MRAHSATAWRINNDDLSWQTDADGYRQDLPEPAGNCRSRLFLIDHGLNIIETQFRPNRDLVVLSRMPQQERRMVLTLSLSGQSGFRSRHGGEIRFKAGYSTVTTFNASDGERQYRAGHTVSQLRFSMTQHWLESYFGEGCFADYFEHSALQVVGHQHSSPSALIAGHSLLCNTLPDQSLRLFRQGLAMAIVASELGRLLSQPSLKQSANPRDRTMAEGARDILSAEFKQPPSVTELSRRVGTNPFKLKQLFHRYFDTTPYGLLLDVRMQKAHQLLSSARLPINRVAEEVGYSHASNFSAAFLKYFGFPPKQLSGNPIQKR